METVRSTASLGAVARAARIRRGWSQQRAADEAGVSRRFVNMLESGQHRNAELWRVLALLEAVGVELAASLDAASPAAASPAGPSHTPAGEAFDLDTHLSSFRTGDPS